MTLPERLYSPHFARLWSTVHERLSRGHPVAAVEVPTPTPDEKLALADLLDLRVRPGGSCRVRIAKLDAVCREAAGVDARAVVTEIVGPVRDDAGDRAAARSDRDALRSWVRDHPVVTARPELASWARTVRFTHGSTAATEKLWRDALLVVGALPAHGRPLPDFAQDVVGDTKALNEDTALSGLVLRALAALDGLDPPASSEGRRRLWERHGVHSDQLSVSVLAAGLRPTGDDLVATVLRACADAGQAASLTLAQLRTTPTVAVDSEVVWAVENPAILALAVDRFGPSCPPLVCTSGWPNGAATLLLRLLAAHATVRYHGDLDGEGVRIAEHIVATTGAATWRMTAADYRSSVRGSGPDLGRVTDASWDPDLAPAMREHGVAVFEEQIAATLLDDISSPPVARGSS